MSSTKKLKVEIENDLKINPEDSRYEFVIPNNTKSKVWSDFRAVKYEGKQLDFAQCNKCKDILSYSSKFGTGSLIRHACNNFAIAKKTTTNAMDTFFLRKVPAQYKAEIAQHQLGFVTKDLRPFCVTEGL